MSTPIDTTKSAREVLSKCQHVAEFDVTTARKWLDTIDAQAAEIERLRTCPGCGVVYEREAGALCRCGAERLRQRCEEAEGDADRLALACRAALDDPPPVALRPGVVASLAAALARHAERRTP